MIDAIEKRGKIVRHLQVAMELADELEDGETSYLIERALDAVRTRLFVPYGKSK